MTAPKPLTSEPAVTTGASVAAVVVAVLGLLTAFGVDLTPDQSAAILAVVAVVAPIVTAFLIRRQVWSPAGLAQVMPVHEGAGPSPEDEADDPGEHRAES